MIDIGTLRGRLELDDVFTSKLDLAVQSIERAGEKWESVSGKIEAAGKGLASLAGAASLEMLADRVLELGKVFEEAGDKIRVTTGATGQNLANLEESFKTVFKTVPASAADASSAVAELNQRLGLTGAPLEHLSEQLLNLARITGTSINSLIPESTRLFGSWQVATEDQSTTLDTLYKISQKTGVGMDSLLSRVTDSGSAFRQMGFSLETSAALLGKWEKEGFDSGQIIGALTIAARKFATQNIPMEQGLASVVDRMKALGPGAASAKLAVETFGRGAIGMIDALNRGALSVSDLVSAVDSSHDTINKAAEDTLDFSSRMTLLKNNVTAALEPLGIHLIKALELLEPAFYAVIGVVEKAVGWFERLPIAVQDAGSALVALGTGATILLLALSPILQAAGALLGLAGAFAPATAAAAAHAVAMGTVAEATTTANIATGVAIEEQTAFNFMAAEGAQLMLPLSGGIAAVGEAASVAEVGAGGFVATLAAVALPVTAVVAAVAALVVVTRELTGSWDFLTDPLKSVVDLFGSMWDITKSLADIGATLWGMMGGAVGILRSMFPVLSSVVDLYEKMFDSWSHAPDDPTGKAKDKLVELRTEQDLLVAGAKTWAQIIGGIAATLAGIKDKDLPNPGPAKPFQFDVSDKDMHATFLEGMKVEASLPPLIDPKQLQAVEKLKEANADLIIQAKAWVQFAGSDTSKLPLKVQGDYYKVLQSVVDQFGSLKKAGLGALTPIYDALNNQVGALHKVDQEYTQYHEKLSREVAAAMVDMADKKMQALAKTYLDVNTKEQAFFIARDHDTMSSTDFARAQVDRWVADQKRGFDAALPFVQQYFALIDQSAADARRDISFNAMVTSGNTATNILGNVPGLRTIDPHTMHAPGTFSTVGGSLKGGLGDFGANLGGTVLQAITGGGSVTKSVGALAGESIGSSLAGNFKTVLSKSALGKTLLSFIPGIGAIAGPLIAKGLSLLGGALGMGTAGRSKVTDFASQMGGYDALQKKLEALGTSGADMWKHLTQGVGKNDAKGAQAAIDDVTKALNDAQAALDRYGLSLDDLKSPADRAAASTMQLGQDLASFSSRGADVGSVATKLAGPLNDALRQAIDSNTKLDPSFGPYLESLAKSGGIADDLARKILGLPPADATPWQDMEEAAKEFGINIDQLGPKFQQAKLNSTADDLAKKFKLLTDNGADVNVVLGNLQGTTDDTGNHIASMAEQANDFLHNAMQWGLELPPSMKPMLEAMAKAGLLTDSAGNALDTLDGIHFGVDLTKEVDDLVKALWGLVGALGSIPNPEITPHVNAPDGPGANLIRGGPTGASYDPTTGDGYYNHDSYDPNYGNDAPAFAAGGTVDPTPGGTLIRVGEGGESEDIVPASKRGPQSIVVQITQPIYVAGTKVDEVLTRRYLRALKNNTIVDGAGVLTQTKQLLGVN